MVGLYLNPHDHALVLSVDEKRGCRALDRTQPVLPMGLGYVEGATHDYVRHGTTTLFAALDIASGTVFTECSHANVTRSFLPSSSASTKPYPSISMSIGSSTLRHPQACQCKTLARRAPPIPRPLHAYLGSWLNLVERWFALLTERQLGRGIHRSTKELKAAINSFIEHHNTDPKPFVSHKTADQILDSVARFCKRTNDSGH